MRHLLAACCLFAAVSVSHAQTPAPRADAAAPELASVHAVVADFDTGETLFTKQADAVVPIASLTKLMMAMVTLDAGQPLDEWLKIVKECIRTVTPQFCGARMVKQYVEQMYVPAAQQAKDSGAPQVHR